MPLELIDDLNDILHSKARLQNLRNMREEVARELKKVFAEVGIDVTCTEHINFDDSEFTR